jgi:hypothetical protein
VTAGELGAADTASAAFIGTTAATTKTAAKKANFKTFCFIKIEFKTEHTTTHGNTKARNHAERLGEKALG